MQTRGARLWGVPEQRRTPRDPLFRGQLLPPEARVFLGCLGDREHGDAPAAPASSAREDARKVARRLSVNGDGSDNFGVAVVDGRVSRARLRREIHEFFAHTDADDLALYFSGHGLNGPAGGFLVTSDAETDDVGIPMQEIVDLGAGSGASSIVLLLDCCSAGAIASPGWAPAMHSVLRKNMTVISASLSGQAALESATSGLFTAALLDALDGAATDVLGYISVSAVYAHIERRFGPWQQRPVMKSYMVQRTILRKVEGKLSDDELMELAQLFAGEHDHYHLSPGIRSVGGPQWQDPARRRSSQAKTRQDFQEVSRRRALVRDERPRLLVGGTALRDA